MGGARAERLPAPPLRARARGGERRRPAGPMAARVDHLGARSTTTSSRKCSSGRRNAACACRSNRAGARSSPPTRGTGSRCTRNVTGSTSCSRIPASCGSKSCSCAPTTRPSSGGALRAARARSRRRRGPGRRDTVRVLPNGPRGRPELHAETSTNRRSARITRGSDSRRRHSWRPCWCSGQARHRRCPATSTRASAAAASSPRGSAPAPWLKGSCSSPTESSSRPGGASPAATASSRSALRRRRNARPEVRSNGRRHSWGTHAQARRLRSRPTASSSWPGRSSTRRGSRSRGTSRRVARSGSPGTESRRSRSGSRAARRRSRCSRREDRRRRPDLRQPEFRDRARTAQAERIAGYRVRHRRHHDHGDRDAVGAEALALQPDGKIVVAGSSSGNSGVVKAVLLRYDAGGSLDAGFGSGRITALRATPTAPRHTPSRFSRTGRRRRRLRQRAGLLLARYTSNGTLDQGFGSGGRVVTTLNGYSEAAAVAIQPTARSSPRPNAGRCGQDLRRRALRRRRLARSSWAGEASS